MFKFGLMTDAGPRVGEDARLAEEHGFDHFWLIDSPIGWREMSPYMTLAVVSTRKLIVGACCTNPVTRNVAVNASLHATLQELSGGRVVLGLGKGDSAVRRIGERPAKLRELKERAPLMQRLASGQKVVYTPETPAEETWHEQGEGELTIELAWAMQCHMPLYIAGYGPKILEWSGGHADGIFMQIAEPTTVEWAVQHLKKGADAAGRNVRDIEIVVCTPSIVTDDLPAAQDAVRGFPAYVSNHVVDMLRYYDASALPANLVACVSDKGTYDYRHHTESTAEHAATVTDELAETYTVIGTAAQIVEKLRLLRDLGATQLCIYFMGIDPEEMEATVATYAREIIPQVKAG
ncbi:MAG: LLM class flavin-dependent oxidoreductase [Actinomycetia bacterium]|nr:LLM class flavin-dependent oxidoreductase [Actinomycetes bacterium]